MGFSEIHNGKQLKALIKENKIRIKELEEITQLSRQGIYSLFKKERFKKIQLAWICSLLGVEPDYFGFPKNLLDTRFSSRNKSNTTLVCFNDSQFNDYKAFIEAYFKQLQIYAGLATLNYYAFDYFVKKRGQSVKQNETHFHGLNANFLSSILHNSLSKRKQKSYRYYRIAMLPIDIDRYPEFGDLQKFEKQVDTLIELLFQESFEHIWDCFNRLGENFELYLIKNPIRTFSFYITDNQYILTAYDRYDKIGIPVPDTLFIEKANTEELPDIASIRIKGHLKDFKNLIENKNQISNRRVYKEVFFNRTITLSEKLERERVKTIKSIAKIKQDLGKDDVAVKSIWELNLNLTEKRERLAIITKRLNKVSEKLLYITKNFQVD